MKILVVQDHLRSGGTERQSILLARSFLAAGHPASLLTFRPGGALAPTAQGLAHRVLQPFDTGLDWFAPGLHGAVGAARPDIVLCMGRLANSRAAGMRRALRRVHADAAVVATMRTGKRLPWGFRRSLPRVDQVVANSHDARTTLLHDYRVPADRVAVIHNALVFPASAPDLDPARRAATRLRFGATPATPVALCVGMFRPEKNQRELIDLFARLPRERPWQLWLAGEGPALAACRARVTELKLDDRIRFPGFQADPGPLYAAADIAVLTSRSESLSNFLIEAQSHGLPAVAYHVTGVGETFVPGESGTLVEPGDQTAFRQSVLALFHDPALRARQAERAREHARAAFAPARQAQAYLDLFKRLLNSPRP